MRRGGLLGDTAGSLQTSDPGDDCCEQYTWNHLIFLKAVGCKIQEKIDFETTGHNTVPLRSSSNLLFWFLFSAVLLSILTVPAVSLFVY